MIRVAIVEDEKIQYKILNEHLLRYAEESGEHFEISYFPEAVNFISDYNYNFDLIFMDIMLPDLDGMKAAERLRRLDENVALIFVTNMEQYAVQGYNVSALYYLLKPIKYNDFRLKMKRTLEYIAKSQKNDYIMLNLPGEKRKLFTREIRYVEVFAHDVVFHTGEEEIHIRGTLLEFEKKLGDNFCRINSCYLVNLNHISSVKDRSVLIGKEELNISFARKKAVLKALADYASKMGV